MIWVPKWCQPRSQHAVALPGPSHSAAQRDNALSTPLGSSTHSLLGNLPCTCYREIGPRETARPTVLSSGNQTPKTRGQRSTSVNPYSRCRAFTYKSPSTEMPSYRLNATYTPLNMWGPTLPRRFGGSRIAESTTPSPLLLGTSNAESPMLRIRATCLCSAQRSQLNRGIALRDSDVHGIFSLANPDPPIRNQKGSLHP